MEKEESQVSMEQLQDVKDRLVALDSKDPKTPILIPFGGRAFFQGQLNEDAGFMFNNDTLEGTTAVHSRKEAIAILKDRIAKLRPPARLAADDDGAEASVSKNEAPANPSQGTQSVSAVSPFIDIREELDENGNVSNAETTDVTKHLEHLQLLGEDLRKEETSTKSTDKQDETVPLEILEPPPKPRGTTSEEEHRALRARFDELAKLEENTEKNKTEAKKSARKLQSSGWAKGFLTTKPKKKKAEVTTTTKKKVAFQEECKTTTPSLNTFPAKKPLPPNAATPAPKPLDVGIVKEDILEKKRSNRTARTKVTPKRTSRFAQERKEGMR